MTTLPRVTALVLTLLVAAGSATSQTTRPAIHEGLGRLSALSGEWSGPAVWDQGGKKGGVEFKLSYKVTSGGKTVLETMFPGTPGEMVTAYHQDGDDLMLVHFCTSGNQPRMKRVPGANPDEFAFKCQGGTNMKETDSHMHSARLRIIDADHIEGEWSSVKGDVVQWVATAQLTRQK